MTKEIKQGMLMMTPVVILHDHDDGSFSVGVVDNSATFAVRAAQLFDRAPSNLLIEKERAAGRAALAWQSVANSPKSAGAGKAWTELLVAIHELQKAQCSPGPMADLARDWKIAREYVDVHDPEMRSRMDAALTALEKESPK